MVLIQKHIQLSICLNVKEFQNFDNYSFIKNLNYVKK